MIFHVDELGRIWYNLRELKINIVQKNGEENKDLR